MNAAFGVNPAVPTVPVCTGVSKANESTGIWIFTAMVTPVLPNQTTS